MLAIDSTTTMRVSFEVSGYMDLPNWVLISNSVPYILKKYPKVSVNDDYLYDGTIVFNEGAFSLGRNDGMYHYDIDLKSGLAIPVLLLLSRAGLLDAISVVSPTLDVVEEVCGNDLFSMYIDVFFEYSVGPVTESSLKRIFPISFLQGESYE